MNSQHFVLVCSGTSFTKIKFLFLRDVCQRNSSGETCPTVLTTDRPVPQSSLLRLQRPGYTRTTWLSEVAICAQGLELCKGTKMDDEDVWFCLISVFKAVPIFQGYQALDLGFLRKCCNQTHGIARPSKSWWPPASRTGDGLCSGGSIGFGASAGQLCGNSSYTRSRNIKVTAIADRVTKKGIRELHLWAHLGCAPLALWNAMPVFAVVFLACSWKHIGLSSEMGLCTCFHQLWLWPYFPTTCDTMTLQTMPLSEALAWNFHQAFVCTYQQGRIDWFVFIKNTQCIWGVDNHRLFPAISLFDHRVEPSI